MQHHRLDPPFWFIDSVNFTRSHLICRLVEREHESLHVAQRGLTLLLAKRNIESKTLEISSGSAENNNQSSRHLPLIENVESCILRCPSSRGARLLGVHDRVSVDEMLNAGPAR